jgi:hypothetical protein
LPKYKVKVEELTELKKQYNKIFPYIDLNNTDEEKIVLETIE